jgi:ferric-dicitrate binding protein FerR (iron transport regulator)
MVASDESDNSDQDVARVLRSAGARPGPPPHVTQAVRDAVAEEWRAMLAQRARRRRSLATAAAVAAGLAIALWALLPLLSPPGEQLADTGRSIGTVSSRSSGWSRWHPLTEHQPVHAGDLVATAADGRAALTFEGGVSVRLDHDTKLAMTDRHHITLQSGAVYVDSGMQPRGDAEGLQLSTPVGAVRHVGTQYEVRLVDGGVRIAVREGAVELSSANGATRSTKAGEQLMVSADGAIVRTAISRDDVRWRWSAQTAPEFDIDGRSVSEFLTWAARELGRELVFVTPDSEAQAARTALSGSIRGLDPEDALAAVLPTTPLRAERRGDQLLISVAGAPD